MTLRPARWYDRYPKLAFAIKLLELAPRKVRQAALKEWVATINKPSTAHALPKPTTSRPQTPSFGSRSYDESLIVVELMEHLRMGTDRLKSTSADQLLDAISRAA